jgi:hypothetical protein
VTDSLHDDSLRPDPAPASARNNEKSNQLVNRREESSFCEQKEAKNFVNLVFGSRRATGDVFQSY